MKDLKSVGHLRAAAMAAVYAARRSRLSQSRMTGSPIYWADLPESRDPCHPRFFASAGPLRTETRHLFLTVSRA